MNSRLPRFDVLILGDSHIPDRATELPEVLKTSLSALARELPTAHFDALLFTGDLVQSPETLDLCSAMVKGNSDKIYMVIGNMDAWYRQKGGNSGISPEDQHTVSFPMNTKNIRIGLVHGHQIRPRGDISKLDRMASQMDVSILCSGHTHADAIHLSENHRLLLNPGSCTGAWSFLASSIPSFIHLIIRSLDKGETNEIDNINEEVSIEVRLFRCEHKETPSPEITKYEFRDGKIVPAK